MKEQICKFAQGNIFRDDRWREHASICPDCRGLLAAADWMKDLAESTVGPRDLPAAGFLLFKSRIYKRQLAADRAALPFYLMVIVTGTLLAATAVELIIRGETRFVSVIRDAMVLLFSYTGLMIFAAAFVAIVCSVTAYVGAMTKGSEYRPRKN